MQARKVNGLGGFNYRDVAPLVNFEEGTPSIALLVKRGIAGGKKIAGERGDFTTFFLQTIHGWFDTQSIPNFKGTEFPVVTQFHRIIDRDNVISDFGKAFGGVG